MAKTLAGLFGIVYVVMGVLGFLNTPLVGTDGFFASNALYSIAFLAIGAVLLWGAFYAAAQTRRVNTIVGAVLAVVAIAGFLMVPERGTMLGMLVSGSDHWLNLIAGALLVGSGVMQERVLGRMAHA